MKLTILIILLIFILALISIFFYSRKHLITSKKNKENLSTPFISPHHFKTGFIQNGQMPANNCTNLNTCSLYPIQPVYVNYDPKNFKCCPNNCDVNIFNSPP